ncbi:hypothetical protein [Streptomyces incanus]
MTTPLAPYFNPDGYRAAYTAAIAEHSEPKARGIAGAVAIQAATDAYRHKAPRDTSDQPAQIGPDVTDHLEKSESWYVDVRCPYFSLAA